jgi:hypothetical protein
VLALACGTAPAKERPCLGGTTGDVTVFAPGIGSSEGIAFLNGKLYVSGGQSIREIGTDGKAKTFAMISPTVGMVAWKGALYVAGKTMASSSGAICDPAMNGVIYKVTASGEHSIFATGFSTPNFLTVTPWNTLLVSDDCTTNPTLWEINEAGQVSHWSDDVLSANGMVFNPAGDALFVASTFTNPAPLWRLPVASHKAGTKTKLHDYDSSDTPDGLALDTTGALFVALNTVGKIHRVQADGTEDDFAQGMEFTASMAFGDGDGFDPCSLYTTSLLGNDLYRVVTGTHGVPLRQ